jgi:hypothetical protein
MLIMIKAISGPDRGNEKSRVPQFTGVQIKNQTTTVFSEEHCVVKAHYRGRQMVLFSDSFPPFSQY